MSVKVDRKLVFKGSAADGDNIEGNPSCSKMVLCDDFNQVAIDLTNDYEDTLGGTNDLCAINTTYPGGWIMLTTGDTDDDLSHLSTQLIFDITKNPVIETKILITTVLGTEVFFGFSDAITEAAMAGTIEYPAGTLTAAAANAAGFLCSSDKTSSLLFTTSISSTVAVAATTTGITWADGEAKVLRIELKSDGDAHLFVDGVLKGIRQAAVADVPLSAMFNWAQRGGVANLTVFVDYLKCWQDR